MLAIAALVSTSAATSIATIITELNSVVLVWSLKLRIAQLDVALVSHYNTLAFGPAPQGACHLAPLYACKTLLRRWWSSWRSCRSNKAATVFRALCAFLWLISLACSLRNARAISISVKGH